MPGFTIHRCEDQNLSEEEVGKLADAYAELPSLFRHPLPRYTPSPGFIERLESIVVNGEAIDEWVLADAAVDLPEFIRRIVDEEA